METNNNNLLYRMDLSVIHGDIISIISKYLLKRDDKFRFNKIFRKKRDNNLLKFFFGIDEDIFRYVNNYIGLHYFIECKEIYLKPLMDCINGPYNTKITGIKLFYHPQLFKDGDKFYFILKCKDKEGKAVHFQEVTVNGVKLQNLDKKLKKIIKMMNKWEIGTQCFEFKLNIADFCYENDIEYF